VALTTGLAIHEEETHSALAPVSMASGAAELALLAGYLATSGRASKPYTEGLPGKLMRGAVGALAVSTLAEAVNMARGKPGRLLGLLSSAAALAGGALLRWGVVKAGRASAADREGTLHSMRPRRSVPGWMPGARPRRDGSAE
jgi:hypothetical protein